MRGQAQDLGNDEAHVVCFKLIERLRLNGRHCEENRDTAAGPDRRECACFLTFITRVFPMLFSPCSQCLRMTVHPLGIADPCSAFEFVLLVEKVLMNKAYLEEQSEDSYLPVG